ncbi:MAG: bifunctional protein-serine/threonine kinase/phosphatase [Phenylobacterium sp.]|uniref:bifunctional protein-serine/threonine kinase/phosphatase n=1 Tax=Phenylobacterium sp. TaxID=1871053 RepID=UPI002733CCC7|nr:bifunctional protein-serine/threonine kinase/phosphatase [Phenylobacterium sp.]MDP3175605.1 bifunctional protein-serine/threonine kinase/phosphatase [Phenylobacterium sp.]
MDDTQTSPQVLSGMASEAGRRPHNEDFAAVLTEPPGRATGVAAAIADGIGGAKGGRVAAELAVRQTLDGYLSQSEAKSVRRTAGHAIESANRWIHAQGRIDPALKHMGSTLTVAILRGRRLHVLHVGDTRLYRLRDGRLTRLTVDHRAEGQTNVLTRAIGAQETVRIDYASDELQPHDRLALLTDGVHGALSDRRIEDEMARRDAPDETARRLVRAALDAGSDDNATALVLDVPDLPAADVVSLSQDVADLPMREPPQVGETVDGFELQAVLANGRYSRVFRALDQTDGAVVLVKFPKPQVLGAEAQARAAFLRESWVASRVQNPFVGAVLDVPVGRRTSLYLVQPFYAGETLERRLTRRPPVSFEDGLDIAVKLTKAAASLHRAGVIHRDIKPDNVILEAGGGLKLIDLGVARLPNLEAELGADIPGTPSFMAPELFAGEPGDERADIFALGVTAFAMFTGGKLPYGEIEPFTSPRHRRRQALSASRPDLPAWLEATLAKALAVDPKDRFQDAFELAFELENGAIRGAPARRGRPSLYERDPLRFWQVTALVLLVLLLASLAR